MKRKQSEDPSNANFVKREMFDTNKEFKTMEDIVQTFLIICLTSQIALRPATMLWTMMTNPSVAKVISQTDQIVQSYITLYNKFRTF